MTYPWWFVLSPVFEASVEPASPELDAPPGCDSAGGFCAPLLAGSVIVLPLAIGPSPPLKRHHVAALSIRRRVTIRHGGELAGGSEPDDVSNLVCARAILPTDHIIACLRQHPANRLKGVV
jgi:hypothetical protein